ncbi:hypothetical protein [Epilithonimonas sp.]|uniref:hypothetical protein n=1 Tax=Epilithonimonas sp. TaxID=2894511 RepID=UPI002FDD410A
MKKSFLYILFLLLAQTELFCQKKQDNFTEIIGQEEGDLNKDKIDDKIVVSAGHIAEIRPFRLQIFFVTI